MSVAQLTRSLDQRLHLPHVDEDVLEDGCRLAADLGMAAVTCRPEHVPTAASHLDGGNVRGGPGELPATGADEGGAGRLAVAEMDDAGELATPACS